MPNEDVVHLDQDDVLPSMEGHDRQFKDASTAYGLNAVKQDGIKASGCMEGDGTPGRPRASSPRDGGDVAMIPPSLQAAPFGKSPTRPASQYRSYTKVEFDKPKDGEFATFNLLKESCRNIAWVSETTETVPRKRQEARRASTTHTRSVLGSNVDLDPVSSIGKEAHAAEQSLGQSHRIKDDFEELLAEAIQQSDAERAQDKEDASNFAMLQNSSLEKQLQKDLRNGTPGRTQPAKNNMADDRACDNDYDHDGHGQSDTKHDTTEVTIPTIESGLPPALPATTLESNPVRHQWVQYISPEGYPYLYDEVTGDSKWAVPGEQEETESDQSLQVQQPSSVKASRDSGSTVYTLRNREEQMHPHGNTDAKEEGKGETACTAENSSVSTCDVSQWSQETSGPDARNSAGETAMHLAATHRSLRGLSLLLANGANINAIDYRGRTALHAVCASANNSGSSQDDDPALLDCMDLLLSSGAFEDARDGGGQTALHLAALVGNLGAAKTLLRAGARVTADDAGNSPLHVAAAEGHSDIIQLFVAESRSSDTDTRGQAWTSADVGRLGPTTDGGFAAEGEQTGSFPGNIGKAFDLATTGEQQQNSTEEAARCSRESYLRYNSRRIQPVTGENSPPKIDCHHLGELTSLESPPDSFDGQIRRAGVYHEQVEAGWQGNIGTRSNMLENRIRELATDHGHLRRPKGKGGRKRIIRRPRQRHEDDRSGRILHWPEALPEREYQEIMEAVFAGEEDSFGRQSHSTVSAALFAACLGSRFNDVAAVLRLLELHGGGITEVWDDNGRTPLHHVCRVDDVSLLHLLCRAGADLEARDCQGNSPLAVAAATGSLACMQALIQKGSYVCGSNDIGDTPLHLAVRHGDLKCVKALVEGGARLSQRNKQGLTPREDLLNAVPMFTKGRLPNILRIIFEYIECAEVQDVARRCLGESVGTQINTSSSSARTSGPLRRPLVKASMAQPHSPSMAGSLQVSASDHLHDGGFGADSSLRNGSTRHGQQLSTSEDYDRKGLTRKPHTSSGPHSPKADGRQNAQREECWDLQLGTDDLEGRSKDSSDGSERGILARRDSQIGFGKHRAPEQDAEQMERRSNSSGEGVTRGGHAKESPSELAGAPSRVRKGVWSFVGRALDSFIGGGNGGYQGQSKSAADESDGSNDSILSAYGNGRPQTNAELNARMGSKEGGVRTNASDMPGVASQLQFPPPTKKVNVPISLTPMQPPPDVLAAMKGRAALGQRYSRYTSPPADVATVLEKNRAIKRFGREESCGRALGVADGGSGNGRSSMDRVGRSDRNM